jgi:DNA segregation ATPase FtsK/SpoIIIE, S-DNA-T family
MVLLSVNMAKNGSRKYIRGKDLKKETWQAVIAIICFVLALLTILAAFHKAGQVGDFGFRAIKKLTGIGYFLSPVLLVMLGVAFLKGVEQKFQTWRMVGSVLFFVSGLGLINLLIANEGGILGRSISAPLISLLDVYATAAVLIAVLAISILITFDLHFTTDHLLFWQRWQKDTDEDEEDDAVVALDGDDEKVNKAVKDIERKYAEEEENEEVVPKMAPKEEDESGIPSFAATRSNKPFVPPPLSLLEKDKGKPETGDIKANANIIKRTLANFGISVEMDEISIGPSVTRYALKPAEGVKLSKIVALNNDLSLALAAHPIRIEAPIPGKSLVGIEIPNTTKTTVGLATLLGSEEYQTSEKPLLISMGKGISGKSFFANLAKAPHMLVAGATGSGKSVTIHAIVASLLFRNSPEDLKFIMIDPKRVELTLYNKIPHLLTPVITDPKKAILALKWAAKEMSRRYDVLEKNAVRDIQSYHKSMQEGSENMPYIVIIIDELADIMQTYPRELESSIVRLAQMSRAVGIHLILSTQRPSVNVITGLIKANVPTRVALQVASQIDSRTILDAAGAEDLLGAGDMLFQGADMAKPIRLQSAYITETETKKVAKYLADTYKDEIMGEINLATPEVGKDAIFSANLEDDDDIGEEDDMYEQAKETVIETGKASTSFLQRKLGIGYSRAARLMDILEKKGVIGPANGAKPREVYTSEVPNSGSSDTTDETAL